MNFCDFIQKISSFISNNSKEIIGIIGTLCGTFLGWLLKYIQDNHGKTEILISKIIDEKSKKGEYSLCFDVFICNHSLSPKYIKDLKLCFYKRKKLFECSSNKASNYVCCFDIDKDTIVNIIELKYNEPQYLKIQNIFNNEQVKKFQNAKKIKLQYKTEKGKTKKIVIKKKFSIEDSKIYTSGYGFPIP